MNKILLAVVFLIIPMSAIAQTATSLTQSNSNSFSRTGSSTAILAPVSGNNYSQPAIAPDLSNITADQCALGAGVSGAGGGIISAGINWTRIDKDCRDEGNGAAWNVLGFRLMAIGSMCLDPQQADLYKNIYGTPCPGQPGWKPAAFPETMSVSAPVTPAPNPVESEHAKFCASLNPTKPEDRPYIAADCK
jgi:hypothetical protein